MSEKEKTTEERFTRGEWKASGNGVHVGSRCVAVTDFKRGDEDGYKLACAHARLIAAAPELLAIAERVAGLFENTDAPLGIDARQAISKALGRE